MLGFSTNSQNIFVCFKKYIYFIYLTAPSLSFGTWNLQSLLQHGGSFNCGMWSLVP